MSHQERIGLISKSKNYKHNRSLSMPKLVSGSLRKIIESRLHGTKQKETAPVSKWPCSPEEESTESPERLIISPCNEDDVFRPSSVVKRGGLFHERLLRLDLSDKKNESLVSNENQERKESPIKWQIKVSKDHHPTVEPRDDVPRKTQSSECLPDYLKPRIRHQQDPVDTNLRTHTQTAGGTCKDDNIRKADETAHASPKPRHLLNCTEPDGSKNWRVGRSTLMAYGAMRGPQEKAPGVPRSKMMDMGDWTQRSRWMNGKDRKKNEDSGPCHSLIEDLQPLMHGQASSAENKNQAEQKEVVLVPRPPYKHIEPPANFKSENHKEPLIKIPIGYINKLKRHARNDWKAETDDINAPMKAGPGILPKEAAKKDWDDDFLISDNEGDPMDSRISPCTFRLWAAGCQRWDMDKSNKAQDVKTQHCHQHQSRNQDHTPKQPGTGAKQRRDASEDERSEALSFSPLGPEKMCHMKAWQRDVSRYTFPIKELCKDQMSDWNSREADISTSCSRGYSEPYTNSEVWNALQAEDAPILAGIQPDLAESVLLQRSHALNHETLAVEHMMLERAAAELRIAYRKKQLAHVSSTVEDILNQRESQWSARRKSIYASVAQYLRESNKKVRIKRQEALMLKSEVDVLVDYEKYLERRLREEALRVMDRRVIRPEDIDSMVWHLSGGGVEDKDVSMMCSMGYSPRADLPGETSGTMTTC